MQGLKGFIEISRSACWSHRHLQEGSRDRQSVFQTALNAHLYFRRTGRNGVRKT